MKKSTCLWVALAVMASQLVSLTVAHSDTAGRLTLVEGRVDLMRGGQLPATPVKLHDGVQAGDVLRTKSLSKAQITFIDNSTLTISPESRVAIEEYMFNPSQKKRNAVIQLFQGLAHVVVHKVFQAGEPDFVVKTHTAIMGIRGTEFGIRLSPNSSTIMDFQGIVQVGNTLPEVGQLFRRAFKIAYAWGGDPQRWVFLQTMQGTTVDRGMYPTMPFTITPQDQKTFMNQLSTGLISRRINSSPMAASNTGGTIGGTGSNGITDQGVGFLGIGTMPTVISPLRMTPPTLTQTAAPTQNNSPAPPQPQPSPPPPQPVPQPLPQPPPAPPPHSGRQ